MEAEPLKADQPKRKRRWFQFSLRTLMIATAIIAVGSALVATRLRRAQRQRAAVKAILKDGGIVLYDYELDSKDNQIAGAQCPGPEWLRSLFGDDFFADVVGVEAKTDASLEHIVELIELHILVLENRRVTDSEMQALGELKKLKWLNLNGDDITDAGLELLARLSQLRTLMLWNTYVTDQSIEKFQQSHPDCEVWPGAGRKSEPLVGPQGHNR
jgi:hypothetical protein